jgi:hypothetical protein
MVAVAATLAAAAPLAAGCTGSPTPTASHSPTAGASAYPATAPPAASYRALAGRYLAIAEAGNRRLETDFSALEARDRSHLAAARRDLADATAAERLFDRRLLRLPFPPSIAWVARFLVWLNQSRAKLTSAASHSTSLRQLRAFQAQFPAANKPVEQAVGMIRDRLGLPPAETS